MCSKIIRLLALGKKIFKVFIIYGHGGHLGHVTKTIFINLCFPFPWSSTLNLRLIGQAVSEKNMFENDGHIHV